MVHASSWARVAKRLALLVLAAIAANAGTVIADQWQIGNVITYTNVTWPDYSPASTLLLGGYGGVYASNSDVMQVGIPDPSGFSISFGDASHVQAFLPQAGTPGPLTSSQTNPGSTEAGIFGGDVVALQLDVDFSDAGLLVGSSGLSFGDIILANFTDRTDLGSGPLPLAILNGVNVRDFLADANTALGGGPRLGGLPISDLDQLTALLNVAFDKGNPDQFAQDHLVAPSSVPEPSSWALAGFGLLWLTVASGWQRGSRTGNHDGSRLSI